MQKRAQFYLIAALVIIGVITGLSTIYNSVSTSKQDESIYFLADEIEFEISNILSSSVFNSIPKTETQNRVTTLVDFYSQTNPNVNFYIFYGNETEITFIEKEDFPSEIINISLGLQQFSSSGTTLQRNSNTIKIEYLNNQPLIYQLKPTQTTFVVLIKKTDKERYIATS